MFLQTLARSLNGAWYWLARGSGGGNEKVQTKVNIKEVGVGRERKEGGVKKRLSDVSK